MPLIYDFVEARACWTIAAARFGAQVTATEIWPRTLRFEATVDDGRKILAHGHFNAAAKNAPHVTDILTVAAAPPALKLTVRGGHVYPLGRALGIQDVIVGDEAFDGRFVIKTSHEELAGVWLPADVRARLLAADDYDFHLRGGELMARISGLEIDPARFEKAIHAVAALGARGERVMDGLRALAARLGGRMHGGPSWLPSMTRIDREVRGVPCHVGWVMEKKRVLTRVVARRVDVAGDTFFLAARGTRARPPVKLPARDADMPALGIHHRVYASDATLLARRFPRRACELVQACRALTVEGSGAEVAMTLPGMVDDEARLRDALEAVEIIASAIVSPSSGPYR